jgi:hypothetical protein
MKRSIPKGAMISYTVLAFRFYLFTSLFFNFQVFLSSDSIISIAINFSLTDSGGFSSPQLWHSRISLESSIKIKNPTSKLSARPNKVGSEIVSLSFGRMSFVNSRKYPAPEREGFEPNAPICSISVIYKNSFR